MVLSQIVITELIIIGPNSVPLGEDISAIGEWAPLVGAFFALFGSLVKFLVDKKIPSHPSRHDPEILL